MSYLIIGVEQNFHTQRIKSEMSQRMKKMGKNR